MPDSLHCHLHHPGLWRMQWLPASYSTGPPEQSCPLCDTVAMEDTYNNIAETMWLAQHQAAGHVPQPGLALQGEDGQEAKLHLQEYRGPARENDYYLNRCLPA